MVKSIPRNSRHIIWNWEKSPDLHEGVRYHVVVVDDKRREGIMEKAIQQIQEVHSGVTEVRSREGKVKNSRLKYLFRTFDTPVAPREINWAKISDSVRQEYDLYERKVGSLEAWVDNHYNRT